MKILANTGMGIIYMSKPINDILSNKSKYIFYMILESLITKTKVSQLKVMSKAHNYNVLIILCSLYSTCMIKSHHTV